MKTDPHKLKQEIIDTTGFQWFSYYTARVYYLPYKNNSTKKSLKDINQAIANFKTFNKTIIMADKLPDGWKMVEEYLSDNIAGDSDNKRKLRATESRKRKKKENSRKS